MSRNSDNVSLSDKYALLLDGSLKENQALREQLKECDEENAAKFQDPANKVNLLYELLSENNAANKKEKSKKNNSKLQVPSRCQVSIK